MDAKTAEMGIAPARPAPPEGMLFTVIGAVSICHMLNDLIQSLVPSIYPILKSTYALDFGQIGLITFVFQITASLLQPVVGVYTDRHPKPFSLPFGMGVTLCGLVMLAFASSYAAILIAAGLIGVGSSIFHPEAARVARSASGGRHGTAQSFFQVGGNFGQAIGPLLAAFIIVPRGQGSVGWFSVVALAAMAILFFVGRWYRDRLRASAGRKAASIPVAALTRTRTIITITLLVTLVFSKQVYLASFSSYYTFYLIHHFGLSVPSAQICLFVFLGSVAVGTVLGGPIGDRWGRKVVIWSSILGVLPFTLALPHMGLVGTIALSIPIGLILSSAMPQIIVYAQDILPGRTGLVAGLFFGLAFGFGGLGAAILGEIADHSSIEFVYRICAYLPAIGLVAAFLPDMRRRSPV